MELPGSNYLFTLATISITFASFAALTVILRQMAGGGLSPYDIFLARTVLTRGFMVAVCALLPPLLALLDLSNKDVWRLSSLLTAIVQGLFLFIWWRRRNAATKLPISRFSVVNYVGQWIPPAFLFVIAIFNPTAGLFAVALTTFMTLGFVAYLIGLKVLLLVDSNSSHDSAPPKHVAS